MASIDDLRTWFERDIKFATWAESVQVDETGAGTLEIRLYTDTNEYLLTVTPVDGGAPHIDCVVRARKARAGLLSPRARALLRGSNLRLNERVWSRILGAIVGMELVRVHRREAPERSSELAAESNTAA
jgi:hypothetical protein